MFRSVGLSLVAAVAIAGCGGKGGGTTVVLTTGATKPPKQAGVLGVYRVPARSMEPTLPIGDHVEIFTGQPHVGEIAVFNPPEGATQEVCGGGQRITPGGAACAEPVPRPERFKFIKRIVAGPGDTIKIIEGHVIRNGKREADSYIRPCPGVSECNFPVPIKVPAGDWFMMGDNRGESDDSRFWGPVPARWIIGFTKTDGP